MGKAWQKDYNDTVIHFSRDARLDRQVHTINIILLLGMTIRRSRSLRDWHSLVASRIVWHSDGHTREVGSSRHERVFLTRTKICQHFQQFVINGRPSLEVGHPIVGWRSWRWNHVLLFRNGYGQGRRRETRKLLGCLQTAHYVFYFTWHYKLCLSIQYYCHSECVSNTFKK